MVTEAFAPADHQPFPAILSAALPTGMVLPAGERVYAIGDIHGCDRQLGELHQAILADIADRPVARPQLVHIGDLVDRGPDSAAVIARLMSPPPGGLPTTTLSGNHETMMLDALGLGGSAALSWLDNGGEATLTSWGLSPLAQAKSWKKGIPGGVLKFIAKLPRRHQVGPYIFVHAGLRPGVALTAQTEQDMLWIRQPFLSWVDPAGLPGLDLAGERAIIVHGHTPSPEPQLLPHRICVDTGCAMGGRLTAAVLEADGVRFLQV